MPSSQVRELTATCAAMCLSQSLRDVLQYIVPFTQSYTVLEEARKSEAKVLLMYSYLCIYKIHMEYLRYTSKRNINIHIVNPCTLTPLRT